MNADVEKAVGFFDRLGFDDVDPWQTIRQALRDQEAEIASLKERLAGTIMAAQLHAKATHLGAEQ